MLQICLCCQAMADCKLYRFYNTIKAAAPVLSSTDFGNKPQNLYVYCMLTLRLQRNLLVPFSAEHFIRKLTKSVVRGCVALESD